jgi:hypothetical protein
MWRRLNKLTLGVAVAVGGCGAAYCFAARSSHDERGPVVEDEKTDFQTQVMPLLKQYCTECHGGTKQKAELDLDRFQGKADAAVMKDRELWEKVLEKLEGREMPPEDRPQPSPPEIERITKWIEQALAAFDCRNLKNPGRVTIRRLNRAEYNNTIRDLVGVDFQPADDFPTDDVGYGFDNIGDVLSMSPILVEKYMVAAEQIVAKAIVPDASARVPRRRLEAKDLAGGDKLGPRVMVSRTPAFAEIECPKDATYVIRVKASAGLRSDPPPRLVVTLDDREILAVDILEQKDSAKTREIKIDATAGKKKLSLADARGSHGKELDPTESTGNQGGRASLLLVEFVEIVGPADLPDSHTRIINCQPTGERSSIECARQVLKEFATRAFRRPVTDDELERLVRLVRLTQEQGDSFERGIQLAVQAILSSPRFLFRVELDPGAGDPDGIRALNDFELATRLSYFLWSSMPDDELFRLARGGELQKPDVLDAQVRRMLADAKAGALVENFAGQWLQLRDIAKVTPDPELFPGFDDALRTAMLRETELFFEAVVTEDRSILDFLDADFTFVNERLARHYGIGGARGEDFRRVALSGGNRRGILTHASILTITSNPNRTSPVKRGKWILENILGTPPPPPPPGVDELEDGTEATLKGSLRERMEQHRSKPMCATCHNRMDPLGFAFENFDAIGAWRDFDGKFAIDASGSLPGGVEFDGPPELIEMLKTARRRQFCRCLAEKMLTYALGRGLESYDRCAVDKIIEGLEKHEYKFSNLVAGIVHSEPFQLRGSKGQ